MSVRQLLIQQYENTPIDEIPDLPLYSMSGLIKPDAVKLEKAFSVKRLKELAELKYALWADELLQLENIKPDQFPAGFKDKLDKKYESKTISAILEAPVDALQGLSKNDAKILKQTFEIETVRDLAYFRMVRYAQELCGISIAPRQLSTPEQTEYVPVKDDPGVKRRIRIFIGMLISITIFLMVRSWWMNRQEQKAMQKSEEVAAENMEQTGNKNETPVTETKAEPAIEPVKEVAIAQQNQKLPVAEPATSAGNNFYIVKYGDTLNEIAYRQLGKHELWGKIYRMNKNSIVNPNHIEPGLTLKLPEK